MKIIKYQSEHQSVKPNADIQKRWIERIAGANLHNQGRAGAEVYLSKYGRGISAAKCVGLARMAELSGFPLVSARFWEEAFFLETGERETLEVDGEAASPTPAMFAPIAPKESFGQLPQILTAVQRTEALGLIADPRFGVQEKKDGERFMARYADGVVLAGNKKGFTRRVPIGVAESLRALGEGEYDGELVNGDSSVTLWLFDALRFSGDDLRGLPLAKRFSILAEEFFNPRRHVGPEVRLIPLIHGSLEAKLAHVSNLEAIGAEGFVLKRLDAPYTPGDSHGTQFKFQFRGRAAVISGERNGSKNSVEVFVHRRGGELRSMGSVTIPPNAPIPSKGTILEIEYLYVHPGPDGGFAQPVYLGTRDDVEPEDCVDSKLKVKAA